MAHPNIEQIPPDHLRPWARNARTHSKKQTRQIAESIRLFGFTNPVLIDEEMTILAGHGRVAAAKLLGLETVPCLRFAEMSAAEKRAYVLADNKLALNAGWDEDLLAEEMQALLEIDAGFVADARRWMRRLAADDAPSARALAREVKLDHRHIARALPLAFLAPDIVAAIMDGRQPPELTITALKRLDPFPLRWDEQRAALGFNAAA